MVMRGRVGALKRLHLAGSEVLAHRLHHLLELRRSEALRPVLALHPHDTSAQAHRHTAREHEHARARVDGTRSVANALLRPSAPRALVAWGNTRGQTAHDPQHGIQTIGRGRAGGAPGL